MRHNIDRYADLNADKFAGWMIIFFFMAVMSLIFTASLAFGSPSHGVAACISASGMLPVTIHGTLAATHMSRGLSLDQTYLTQTYFKLPKHLRAGMKLTRDEVLTLNSKECYALRSKMEETLVHFNRDHNGPVGRANSILDSHIDTYKALENMS